MKGPTDMNTTITVDQAGYAKLLDLMREIGGGAERLEPRILSDHFVPGQVAAQHDAKMKDLLTELVGIGFAEAYIALSIPRPPLDVQVRPKAQPIKARELAEKILADASGRSGSGLDCLDDDIEEEILVKWTKIIADGLPSS